MAAPARPHSFFRFPTQVFSSLIAFSDPAHACPVPTTGPSFFGHLAQNTPYLPHEEPGGISNSSKCKFVHDPGGNNLNAMTATTAATTTTSPSHRHPHASVTLFTAAIFQFPTPVSQLQACARFGRNAGSILKTRDGSTRNDGDSHSTTTTSGNVSIRKTPFLLFATFHAFMSKKSKFSESTNYF